ncbi:sensory box histidine kinase/response regulator [Oceanicaulis sp. HTCC2633]|uniref:ATP-binding protein n=1 Tax=Oceanicaulis sp. HTCC2633 TaxID=314254 RepID=UPI0000669867|nr:ATP-binding protein [Oceanicaulis sp. HTCC2633]EAP89425.1 sensory box histidine kinase/response regulator [Oceanicaulis sp. HTCC2633]
MDTLITLDAYQSVARKRARELPMRIGTALFGAFVLFFAGLKLFALGYAVLAVASQCLDHWIASKFRDESRTAPVTRPEKISANLSMLLASIIYSSLSLGLWTAWGQTGESIALLLLCGSLFHIAVHSNENLSLTLSGGGPAAAYLLGLPASALFRDGEMNVEYLLALIAATLFLLHFFIAARRFGDASHRIKDAYRQAEKANAAKSRFLANMSHEIRTPLNGVMGMAQLLEQTELDDRQRDYVRMLNSSGTALRGLIDDVLDISRIEAGELELDDTPYRPADLLRNTADTIASQAASKKLTVELDIAPELEALVAGDATRVLQILTNFAGNAVKFTDVGAIAISGRVLETGQMELSVSDTGPGIAPDQVKSIFERFSQLDDSVGRQHEGAGLGLTIAQEIAVLAGGDIGVESELNAGSRFWVRLPHRPVKPADAAHPGLSDASRASAAAQRAHPERTALVVEDNATNRNLLTSYLEGAGWRVLQASSSAEALAEMDKTDTDPDAVLLDLHMPGLSGEDLLVHFNAVYPDMPVVIVTADVTSGTAQRMREKGAADCLPKPVNLDQLGARLDQMTLKSA